MKAKLVKILVTVGMSLLVFLAKGQLGPLVGFVPMIGAGIAVLGILYWVMELRSGLPFFYGSSQSGGSNANGSVVVGLGIGLLATSWGSLLGCLIAASLLLLLLQKVIKPKIKSV